ncbi:MAG: hypothetical protein M3032_01140 [Verrucomicrobiota bacterium]|nr:hypothetical protein [Verrucomicrobiota bacterium]
MIARRLAAALERAERIVAPARSDGWLAILRIGLGTQVVALCLAVGADWPRLFATTGSGIGGRQFAEGLVGLESRFIPTLAQVIGPASKCGLSEHTTLVVCWFLLLAGGCGLLAGFRCRESAIAAWYLHLCAAKSGGTLSYGVDNFMTIGLFYLMLSPLPDRYSFDFRRRLARGAGLPDARLLGLFQVALQLHLCLIYFFSGLSKLLGSGWWNGLNLWRALIRPPFNLISPEFLVRFKAILPAAGLAICLLELAYPVMIWGRRTRRPWLVAVCAMHVAIGVTMGMYLFALVMIVLNVAAFWLPVEEPNPVETAAPLSARP